MEVLGLFVGGCGEGVGIRLVVFRSFSGRSFIEVGYVLFIVVFSGVVFVRLGYM